LRSVTLAAALALSATPALSWYQGALKNRDYLVDAALVFAYYEKCNAGPIPPDLKKRAEEKLNMAGPSAARWSRGDVEALIKKLGVKRFCEEYRRELTTGENIVVTGGERPDPNPTGHIGQTGDDWAADCRVSDKNSSRYVSCLRFARGVADGFIIVQMLNEAANPPQLSFICVPKLTTSDQIVEVGLRYWNTANSETRSLRASQLLTEAWLKVWPCRSKRE
jgi:Rap1a immunity proteins